MFSTIWQSIMQTGQTTVFISIGLLGFVYLAISALLGGMGHDTDGGSDVHSGDGHDGDTTVSFFSPKVMAIFFVAFGGVGAIASSHEKSVTFSVITGLCSGLVLGLLTLMFLRYMLRQQSNSAIDTNNAVGLIGQITIGIPEDGVGEVGVTVQGSYSPYSARTEDGKPLPFGRRVKVKSNAGGQLVVEAV